MSRHTPILTLEREPRQLTRPRRPVNWRSVTLGLGGVVLIASLTGYNDYVVNNTNFIGSHLPIGLLGYFLVFVLFVNAPLWRWAPRWALHSDELAVALGMVLVGSAIPCVGMMRYLPGHLTAFFYYASTSQADYELLQKLNLPDWIFPTFASKDWIQRGNDAIVQYFIGRAPVDSDTFAAHFAAVPWGAWLTPALTWGLFFTCFFGAILCLSIIVRHQWVENERLPFPLATLYLALIETPKSGGLNTLFRSRGFWLAFLAVFLVHSNNSLMLYFPRYFPEIPLGYNLESIFSEQPWIYMEWSVKVAQVFFTIVGLTMLLQSSVAFSLWFFFIAVQGVRMILGTQGGELSEGASLDQLFGAVIPYALGIVWIGRRHFAMVAGQMFRRPQPGEVTGRYLPYWLVGWGLAGCLLGLITWLMLAGVTLVGALVIVAMLILIYMVVARIVAETGLLYVLVPVRVSGPWSFLLHQWGVRTTPTNYFFSAWFSGMLVHDTRESLPAFATHALRVADEDAYAGQRNWRRGAPFVLVLILALVVSYLVSGTAYLYCHYSYAATIDKLGDSPINVWGSFSMPRYVILDDVLQYVPPAEGQNYSHNRAGHFLFGAGLSGFLSLMRLRFVNWPLHPVGFLMVYTWGLQRIWFSIFLGWLAKVLIVRFGGSRMFVKSRSVFFGLIVGEAAAAAFWLVVSLACVALGRESHSIRFLPF